MANDRHEHEQPHTPAPPKGARIPAAAMAAAYAPRAAGEDDPSAEANSRAVADIIARSNPPIPASRITTAPTSEPLVSGRAMWIIVGPYKGSVLTMPDAEAEDAKDSHWAINMSDMTGPFDANAPLEHDHELTDEDRAHAVEAANTWAAAQNPPPEPDADGEDEPAPEGETEGQREAREKRNAERRERRERNPQPGQQPAQQPGQPGQPGQQPGQHANRGRTVEPQPAGGYETR